MRVSGIATVAILLSVSACALAGTKWAVLVAGSNGYMNYRHQADIYHSYQLLRRNGFPDSNIVLMHYNDIANNRENPKQGQVFNNPDLKVNYFENIPLDYTGSAVSPSNFLAILLGDKSKVKGGSGKVISPTKDDHVFVYFADHGGTGLIAFPEGQPYLYADDLVKTLEQMKFKQMTVYIEACESGSMFSNKLPDNVNIYAVTAANPDQSSYACYWSSELNTYLGDVFSVNWLENTDKVGMQSETLEEQYEIVKKETNTSQVMQYGQLTFDSESLAEFMAFDGSMKAADVISNGPHPSLDAVSSRDVVFATYMKRAQEAKNDAEREYFSDLAERELAARRHHDAAVRRILFEFGDFMGRMATTPSQPTQFSCLREAVKDFEQECGKFTDYSLKYVRALANLCENGHANRDILRAARKACSHA